MVRLVPLVLGGIAIAVGAIATGLSGDPLPTKWLQDVAMLVATILIAGVAVVGLLVRSLETGDDRGLTDDGFGPDTRTPGDAVDERLADSGGHSAGTRADLRDRFESAAVASLVRERGWSPVQARERLESGAWTDDEEAAAFFAGEETDRSLREWLQALLSGESSFAKRAHRATAALFGQEEEEQ